MSEAISEHSQSCSRRHAALMLLGCAGSAFGQAANQGFAGRRAGDARTVEGVRLRWCPPGRFRMGSPPNEPERRPDEEQVDVVLSQGFWIGQWEVTQAEWSLVSGPFPRPMDKGVGALYPVHWVSYLDAERFCRDLANKGWKNGSLPKAWSFRIPTEAQWEYACRAGTTTATAFGDRLSRAQANFNGKPYNNGEDGPALSNASEAGKYPANAWGIQDMHGNIFEWCRDWYHARLPGGTDPDLSNEQGVQNRDGTYSRVRRGGAWNDPGMFCRSGLRLRYEPERRSDHIGFRVVAVRS